MRYQLSELKSTDGRVTLLHYIASLIEKQFTDLSDFTDELFYLDKAASGNKLYTFI